MSRQREVLRYEQVADRVECQIENGTFRPDDRIPSLREMSRVSGVSVGTVIQAYLHLERRGVIYTRPRSGYFVRRPTKAASPPRSKRFRSGRPANVASKVVDTIIDSIGRRDLISFNSAIASSAARVNGRLNSITRSVLRDYPEAPNELSPVAGLEILRREVAKRMSLVGAKVGPDDVVITNGTSEALSLALNSLCRPGDAILVESPTYFGVLQIIEQLRLKVIEIPNSPGRGIDAGAIRSAVQRTKISAAVLQPNFNNPTGALTPEGAKQDIVATLSHLGIPIIEDDIYGDLTFSGMRPQPLSAFDETGNVVTCGSISKTVAIGYRIGWAVSPNYSLDITRAKYSSSVACPTLQQYVLARYFATGVHDRHLRTVREHLSQNCERYRQAILESFPNGTSVSQPDGGVVLWVELPAHVDGVELFGEALAHHIGIAPGTIFSAKGDYRNYIRVSAGIQWTREVEKAIRMLGHLAR